MMEKLKVGIEFHQVTTTNVGTDDINVDNEDDNEEDELNEESDMTYATKFKDFGVRKVFILAIVAKAPETCRNMRVIIQKTQLNKLDNFRLVADLKLLNIILGFGTHSSKVPCPYGQCFKNKDGTWYKGCNRTLQTILENFTKWIEDGRKENRRKDFFSWEGEPLITPKDGEQESSVIKRCPPPPLHLILGSFNHVWKELLQLFPALTNFQDELEVQTSNYQGKRNFEGNQIAKILDNLDKLKDIIQEHLTDFHDTFVAIRDSKFVVHVWILVFRL